jgi:hypothetical protein
MALLPFLNKSGSYRRDITNSMRVTTLPFFDIAQSDTSAKTHNAEFKLGSALP